MWTSKPTVARSRADLASLKRVLEAPGAALPIRALHTSILPVSRRRAVATVVAHHRGDVQGDMGARQFSLAPTRSRLAIIPVTSLVLVTTLVACGSLLSLRNDYYDADGAAGAVGAVGGAGGRPPATLACDVAPPVNAFAGTAAGRVETFPTVEGAQLVHGVGVFAYDEQGTAQLDLVRDLGASFVNTDLPWGDAEKAAGQFALPDSMQKFMDACRDNHLALVVVADYPSPFDTTTLTAASDVAAGQRDIAVNESVGQVAPPANHLRKSGDNAPNLVADANWADFGALIEHADAATNTLTLAAPLAVDLRQGDALDLVTLRYPSVGSDDPTNPSIAAYGTFVDFLAQQMVANQLQGRILIDSTYGFVTPPRLWGCRALFFDSPPAGSVCATKGATNFAFANHFFTTAPPPGITYEWADTIWDTTNTLNNGPLNPEPTAAVAQSTVAWEFSGLLGYNPEDHAWSPSCLATHAEPDIEKACALPNTLSGDVAIAAKRGLEQQSARGWSAKRDGLIYLDTSYIGDDVDGSTARFGLRAYLEYQALGYENLSFHLSELTDSSLSNSPYDAIRDMMTDLAVVANASNPADPAPTIASYAGSRWPLSAVTIAGKYDTGEAKNSYLIALWQRTYTADPGGFPKLLRPQAAAVTLGIPTGWKVANAVNLVTRACVPVNGAGDAPSLPVNDDPLFVYVVPAPLGSSERPVSRAHHRRRESRLAQRCRTPRRRATPRRCSRRPRGRTMGR